MKALVKASELSHIAFIMDGNGRWATNRSLPREAGHSAGAKNFKTVVRYCKSIGIKYVTVYAFSTENWKRPKREVDAIMNLLDSYMAEAREESDVEYRFIGDRDGLPEGIVNKIDELERFTDGREYRLNIALNYGGRAEIVNAVKCLMTEGKSDITEDDIAGRLYTAGCPDADLIVRTGGEYRISNFLMWQSAYSELYFSDKLWPEYSKDDVDEAVIAFSKRKRRFGGLDKK
ncbi:MAG: di-trans,poly-cis-decaprenylcistransferase [Clostridia bacterium]|nr:di-trans,poly-cis-decaprenylcistransferase [Clostridia bacterium]